MLYHSTTVIMSNNREYAINHDKLYISVLSQKRSKHDIVKVVAITVKVHAVEHAQQRLQLVT